MTGRKHAGIDVGVLAVTIATDGGLVTIPAPDGGPVAAVRAAVARVGARVEICIAVPDWWLSGDASGAARQERLRHECEDLAKTGRVSWIGQLAAVGAHAATLHGSGRYLVCDVSGVGVRAGVFAVSDATVRIEATHAEEGGGWREFDAAVRAALPPAQSSRLPARWHEQAAAPEKMARAALVLADAVAGLDDALDTNVYRIAGADGDIPLPARVVIGGFAPTERLLQAAIAAVRGGTPPDHVLVTGALGWLPLTSWTAAGAASSAGAGQRAGAAPTPLVVGPDYAARGALLFARGDASLTASAGRDEVAVPVHRIRDGQLEEINVTLPWSEPFAAFPGGDPTVASEELEVSVAGRPHVARLPGLVPGPHLIGLRPAWPGPGVLVVRPAAGGAPHVIPLANLAAR